ncbi:hypothetical protein Golax_002587, partial [Gossypium laxum]|nr:hypothetical protein [Gossypium laxum]
MQWLEDLRPNHLRLRFIKRMMMSQVGLFLEKQMSQMKVLKMLKLKHQKSDGWESIIFFHQLSLWLPVVSSLPDLSLLLLQLLLLTFELQEQGMMVLNT